MAKKTTHQDAVKSLDEFRAPWETEAGTDAEIDKPKLRRFIHGLLVDKAKAQDARDEAAETLVAAEKELEEAKEAAADANGVEAQKTIDKLQKKVDDLTTERDGLVSANEQAELRKKVLGDLPERYAKYVTGETEEELEESLKAVREDFDLGEPGEENGEDNDDEDNVGRVQPRRATKLVNPADKGGRGGEVEHDYEKLAEDFIGGGSPFIRA